MSKIQEKESAAGGPEPTPQVSSMDPKVVRVYEGVGKVLASHRSGQLPKAFKIIPSLRNWEEILYLVRLRRWRWRFGGVKSGFQCSFNLMIFLDN